jgi:nucleoside-diphosphate kinase
VEKVFKTEDPEKLGTFIYERLIQYWMEGPIIVMVWQGPNAVMIARKLRGHTIPALAIPGTLLAQYSFDSSPLSASLDRVVKTFIHTSGSIDEAEREIKYWFKNTEFKNYEREVDQLYLK